MASARDHRIVAAFKRGKTHAEIAETVGLTPTRIGQILRVQGVGRAEGGQCVRARTAENTRRRAYHQKTYGCTRERLLEIKQRWPEATRRFQEKRRNAKATGLAWTLTFLEWFEVWERSGRIAEQGRAAEQYVMIRRGHTGAYERGNVRIVTLARCCLLLREKETGKRYTATRRRLRETLEKD
jgi:hypothetical protein